MGGGSLGFSTADGRTTQYSIKAPLFGMTQNSSMVQKKPPFLPGEQSYYNKADLQLQLFNQQSLDVPHKI